MVVQAPVVIRGFVAAGGRSSRMGRDKALLPWGEGTLLDHAARRLEAACGSVAILCGAEPRYEDRGWPVQVDLVPEAGPLGGLLTALRGGTACLLLGVDLPHVPEALLRWLAQQAGEADVVVPVLPSGPEPLCAAYSPACGEAVRRCVEGGRLRMTSFWPDVRVRELAPEELARFGDPQRLFRNVNTPGDYEEAAGLRER